MRYETGPTPKGNVGVSYESQEAAQAQAEAMDAASCWFCADCTDCEHCRYCTDCKYCTGCTDCRFCKYCADCTDCEHCTDFFLNEPKE